MSSELIGLTGMGMLILLIVLRSPIGLALLFVGIGGTWLLAGWRTVEYVGANAPVHVLTSNTLSVLPLFLVMGNLAVQSGMATSLYSAASKFVGHMPGGLAAGTILASGGFGAICGSSLATVTTVTRISVPEMLRYGYSPKLAAGSVGAGGTLGILIPPSLIMIIYAYLTETSVGRLFAAGMIPGLVAIALYCGTIFLWVTLKPEIGPSQPRATWGERLRSLKDVMGVGLAFGIVMGGIFLGFFSPTEGAAIGAAAVLVIGLLSGQLGLMGIFAALRDAAYISAMIFLMVIGVEFFQFFMEASRVPSAIVDFFTGLDAPRMVVLLMIIGMLVLLGCVLDSIAIVLIMTPFLYPIVVDLGYDLIWFGIIMVMVVEIGLMTPPFGINVFVINSMVPQIRLGEAFAGVLPFIAADIVRVALLVALPALSLWLPDLLFG
ncbi:TRAP transporter large permease [Pseudooceanicola sp.]|jgi:tripartite ATP-independent transporter DctM subunit|uniref:TRAP transporter large permease n=1 Tax=Pseudooceanicola sp. TaxID=1914328 RepID=UPI004058181F